MTDRIAKLHGAYHSEAQMFFAETRPFPLAGASVTFMIAVNLVATLASLLGQA
jgi:type IV secretory pathway VirB3-like protein